MNDDWKLARLGDVLRNVSRPVRLNHENTYRLVGAHWYAKGLYVKEQKSGSEIQAKTLFEVKEGDFVYNRLFAWKGSFAVASKEVDGCFVSNEFPCFAPLDAVDSKFLWLYFSRSSAWSEALGLSSGSTPTSRNRLKEEQFLNMEVRLPPLNEQRRIVSRIEELADKLEQAQCLRHRAFQEANTVSETVTSRIFDDLTDCPKVAIGTMGRNGTNPVQTGPFGAQLHSSDFVEEGVPVLNVGNVWPEGLRFDRLDHVLPSKADQLNRYALKPSDLLFARSGATLGKVCVVPKQCDGWLMTGHLFRVRFDETKCLPHFAFAALRGARSVLDQVFGAIRGATRPGFNTTLLSRVCIPLPPLDEQQRIVTHLDKLQGKVHAIKRLQTESAAELGALLPSILSKAFRGEL